MRLFSESVSRRAKKIGEVIPDSHAVARTGWNPLRTWPTGGRSPKADRAIVSAGFCYPVRNAASKPWPAWLAFDGGGRGKKGDLAVAQADRQMATRRREGDRVA